MLASSRGPCAAARPRGRDKSRPYELILCFRPNRNGRSPPGGRRAGCPHPAGPPAAANTPVLNRRGAAGVNARPTEPGKHGGQPGTPHRRNPCRGRCSHRPAGREALCGTMLALRPQARFGGQRPQARLLGRRSSRTPRGTANALGGINPAPTNLPKCPAKPDGRNHPGVRRAGCPHPAAPRGGANTRGRIWNPPLRNGRGCGRI